MEVIAQPYDEDDNIQLPSEDFIKDSNDQESEQSARMNPKTLKRPRTAASQNVKLDEFSDDLGTPERGRKKQSATH